MQAGLQGGDIGKKNTPHDRQVGGVGTARLEQVRRLGAA